MEGLSGNGKTIFSWEADSNLGEGGDTGFETFSGKEGAPFWGGAISTAIFPVSGTSIEGGGTADDFSCWREAIFSSSFSGLTSTFSLRLEINFSHASPFKESS